MSENVQTVTSESRAEFVAQRLGLNDKPVETKDAAPQPTPETPPVEQADPAPAETPADDPASKPHKNEKIERRFSELTQKRRDAEAAAAAAAEEARQLREKLAQYEKPAQPAQPAQSEDVAPDAAKYQDPFEYAKDLAEYSARKALENREKQEILRRQQEAQEAATRSWVERVEKAKAEIPDFQEMVESSEVAVSDQVRDAIMDSDVGPQILYYLADNPEKAKSLGEMTVAKALRELGKIEASIEAKAKPVDKTPVPAKVASKAPEPITPIRGGTASPDAKISSSGEFTGTFAEFKALRKAGKI